MVRVQIKRIDIATDSAVSLMALCVKNAKRELLEYLENPSCAVYMYDDMALVAVLETPDTIDILDIAVKPDSQNRGIGKAVLNAVINIYNRPVMLEVRASNAPARALYKSCGFKEISLRKNYYTAPVEDAVIYRREI